MPRRIKPSAHPIDIDDDRPIATKPKNWPATGTRTGTACPTCKREQMWCPSGVVCSDFKNCESPGYVDPSDIPFADTETDRGESLDEALSSMPEERPSPRKGKAKRTGPSPPDLLELGEMERIVERVFQFDFDRAYSNVLEFLKPRDDRKLDLGFLERELDEATDKAREAHRLYTNAREALAIFEIDKDLITSSMRDNARHKLEEDKRNRIRIKPITDADVLGMMKMQDPARWRDLKIKTIRMEATVEHLKYITDLARDRISALKTLVSKK